MSAYVPIAREERKAMLAEVGIDLDQLFAHIPESLRLDRTKLENLPEQGCSELELQEIFAEAATRNKTVAEYDSYLGAGCYDHYIPTAVHHITGRQEFLTSYTPYQQEISQGTLQATYEWQSYITRLTGMDVSNSSMYDGATAAAEAALMAFRVKTKANKIWISGALNPEYIQTIQTYLEKVGLEWEVGEVGEEGTSCQSLPSGEGYAAYMVQSPNFYGVVEDLQCLSGHAHEQDALAVAICDPIALALFKTPGEAGIDICVGEAQPLGANLNYGGPSLGYMTCANQYVRKMPGRICGATVDADGKTAYVLTLQAREQHIRRERATSNICTAQALLATSATIFMALMGRDGMRQAALQSADKARYLHGRLLETGFFEEVYKAPFFREFVLKAKDGLDLFELNQKLLNEKIIGGPVIQGDLWLLAVTEKKSKAAMDRFVDEVKRLAGKEA